MVHLYRLLPRLRARVEVRQLRCHEVFAALVTAQGNACAVFRQSAAVGWRRVEIVQTVLDGVVHLAVDHLLVELVGIVGFRRQAHHAIA